MKGIIITCVIIAVFESYALVDRPKCTLVDGNCQLKLFGGVYQEVVENGIADLGIVKMNPYAVKNVDLNVLGMIKFTIVDGTVIGLKDCVPKSFKSDTATLRATFDFYCDALQFEGHYTLRTLPALDTLVGGINIHGDGDGKINIEKINFSFDYPYEFLKGNDGEYYYHLKPEVASNTFKIDGKVTIAANNIFIGSQDVSQVGVAIINENWQLFMNTLGKITLNQFLQIFYENFNKFFSGVPAKDLITDLSSYVKN